MRLPLGPTLRALALALLAASPVLASTPGTASFVIDGGTRVTLSGATRLALDGDLRNAGVFTPAAGSVVVLDGYGSPVLVNASFADLVLALHGTAALAHHTTVAGTLTLDSGRLSLAGHDLTVTGLSGGSATSYVMTPDTLGRLVRSVGSGANVAFPVGNATYDPVSIRTGTGSDVFRVAVLDAPPTTGFAASDGLTRAWAVSHANAAGVNGTLTVALQWNASESGATFDRSMVSSGGARAWRWLDGAWVQQPGVRTFDNGVYPAIDTLRTPNAGLWTLAGVTSLLGVEPLADSPLRLELASPAPNPLRTAATVRYGLPQRRRVTLALYSVAGQRVATLAEGEQDAGWHVVRLDRMSLASGIYFLQLSAGAETRTHKLAVIR